MVTTDKSSSSASVMPLKTAASGKVEKKSVSAKKPVAKPAARKVVMTTAKPAEKAVAKSSGEVATKPKTEKHGKAKKPKLVRDSFTIPKTEYSVLEQLKQRGEKLANPVKKSELLRAGIKALEAMADGAFLGAIKAVPTIKTGRPAKG